MSWSGHRRLPAAVVSPVRHRPATVGRNSWRRFAAGLAQIVRQAANNGFASAGLHIMSNPPALPATGSVPPPQPYPPAISAGQATGVPHNPSPATLIAHGQKSRPPARSELPKAARAHRMTGRLVRGPGPHHTIKCDGRYPNRPTPGQGLQGLPPVAPWLPRIVLPLPSRGLAGGPA